jgi:hypothetical protein
MTVARKPDIHQCYTGLASREGELKTQQKYQYQSPSRLFARKPDIHQSLSGLTSREEELKNTAKIQEVVYHQRLLSDR